MCVGRYTPASHDSTTSMVHKTYPNSPKCGSAVSHTRCDSIVSHTSVLHKGPVSHTQQCYCALLRLLYMLPDLSSCLTTPPTCEHMWVVLLDMWHDNSMYLSNITVHRVYTCYPNKTESCFSTTIDPHNGV